MNTIMRPVYNRPEMLYLSLEYERLAREYYTFPRDLITLFIIEHGSSAATLELVAGYPFKKKEILRKEKFESISNNAYCIIPNDEQFHETKIPKNFC